MNLKERCDIMTDLIISCWDCNQELDDDGKPIDGLTFDERLERKMSKLEDDIDKKLMDKILEGV